MKHIVAILLVLLLALPCVAEQAFSPYDYVTGSAGGGRYLYYDFPDISLYLPASWEGRFTVVRDEFGLTFYGFLFRLCASEDEDYQDLPACAYLGYSENAGLHFYLTLPPEYTAYQEESIMADYNDMAEDLETVIEMARIAPSLSFYTDDLVSTDAGMS